MANTGSSQNVSQLFQAAQQEGDLSAQSAAILLAPDMGLQIQAGLGAQIDDVQASEVFLVALMPDDSGSIASANNEQTVRDGHNLVIEALRDSKQGDGIRAHCRYLNGKVLYAFGSLDAAVKMDGRNYRADQGTPLYDQTVVLLGTVLAEAKAFEDAGVPARTATLIITDGADLHSRRKAKDVKAIVDDMLRKEMHIVAAMGIDDGGGTDFRRVFRDMGIRDEWILTPGNSASEIRRAFSVFSRSAVRASQSAGSFSQTAAGGFGAP
ncbi:hypothetical protein HYV74_04385 [Candidatus Uhrbacteria bacterium]|nr:hypothetical protein [Candidatus Uhrbacteria bacterium]